MKYKNILTLLLLATLLPSLALAEKDKCQKEGRKGFDKLDSNGDEVITLEEAQSAGAKKLVENFSDIDTDGNGEVSKDELQQHHKQRTEERRSKLKDMDTDGNGSISLEEATNGGADKLVENFEKIDRNGDGEITREEMKKLREKVQKKKKCKDDA